MLKKIVLAILTLMFHMTAVADDNVPILPGECRDRPVIPTPALLEEGRRLFKEETFNGNGRTCETCHRENNNFTIDPDFIATLPNDDPLFVAENNPALQDLEIPEMMRKFGLIRINIDGFDEPGILRSVQHLLGLSQTTALGVEDIIFPGEPGQPIHETGWSADGALNSAYDLAGNPHQEDGSLRCFPVGAIVQHFTKSMDRVDTVDFRLPTENELDALLVYMLSLGRQTTPTISNLTFTDPAAERGKALFFGDIPVQDEFLDARINNCSQCHVEAGANNSSNFLARNRIINTNLSPNAPTCRGETLNPPILDIPGDGGFGKSNLFTVDRDDFCEDSLGGEVNFLYEQTANASAAGVFNIPSLIEAADTGPYFHNNSAETLEDAILFYSSEAFNTSDGAHGRAFVFGPTDVNDIGAFLRAINAIENARSAIDYIDTALASSGKKIDIASLRLALADTKDGIEVLATGPLPDLFPEAVRLLRRAKIFIGVAIKSRNPIIAEHARKKLTKVESQIITTMPLPDVIVTELSYADGIFTSTVKNQGNAATPDGVAVAVGYSVNGKYKTWGGIQGPLAAGASVTLGTNGAPYAIPSGTHTITAWVDDVNRFEESNENNNQLSESITVSGTFLPDVIVTELSYTDGIFTSTVKNQGNAATPDGVAVAVGYSVDGKYKTWGGIQGPLAAGASVTLGTNGAPYVIPSGTHTITAWVDDVDRFEESDENNNLLSESITVSGSDAVDTQ